jgi:hypothetical protein
MGHWYGFTSTRLGWLIVSLRLEVFERQSLISSGRIAVRIKRGIYFLSVLRILNTCGSDALAHNNVHYVCDAHCIYGAKYTKAVIAMSLSTVMFNILNLCCTMMSVPPEN